MEYIDISKKISQFKEHLENNPRTILSAKFGDGKTTFLNKYAETVSDDCLVITLRPVNYSVLKNEDIFEYIKHDILAQLIQKGLLPRFSRKRILEIAKNNIFTVLDIDKTLDNVIQILPHARAIAAMKEVVKAIIEKEGGMESIVQTLSPARQASVYLSSFKGKIGGLYEEDAYTLLIRECLYKQPLNSILVLDDLDRLDPAHLFRILNVLGAHVDENSEENKFGFDNIVVVFDYDVARELFQHFYGPESSYDGYMTKFMSHYPFKFSITETAYNNVYELIESECGLSRDQMEAMVVTNKGKNFGELLTKKSVRDIAHAIDDLPSQYRTEIISFDSGYKISTDEKIVKFLSILKRLNIGADSDSIYNSVRSLFVDGYNLLGSFLLCIKGMGPGYIPAHRTLIGIRISTSPDGIFTCSFSENGYGYEVRVNLDKASQIAYREAAKYVNDFQL